MLSGVKIVTNALAAVLPPGLRTGSLQRSSDPLAGPRGEAGEGSERIEGREAGTGGKVGPVERRVGNG